MAHTTPSALASVFIFESDANSDARPTTSLFITMSTDNQAAIPSASNFTSIFHAALDEYKKLTGQNPHTHPFAAAFDACHSPDTVLNVFQKQAQAFSKGDNKLIKSLTPTIHILLTLSATLGEGVCLVRPFFLICAPILTCVSQPFSPAKAIFTGISVLLAVRHFRHPLAPICVTMA